MFCHSGHEVEASTDDLITKGHCGCGAGDFKGCSTLNSENPIASQRGVPACCMVRDVELALAKEAKEMINPALQ